MTYSSILFAPTHPANHQEQPARHCCLDAHHKKDSILCAGCYKREQPVVAEDDWDEEFPIPKQSQLPISHNMSQDFEGPIWQ